MNKDTALAWSLKYYDLSNIKGDKHEYGSAIYEADGKYAFNAPNIGTATKVSISLQVPEGTELIGAIHSHPKMFLYDYNNFSGSKWYHEESGDYGIVQATGLQLYLAGPNYLVKAADYHDSKISERILNQGMNSYRG